MRSELQKGRGLNMCFALMSNIPIQDIEPKVCVLLNRLFLSTSEPPSPVSLWTLPDSTPSNAVCFFSFVFTKIHKMS